MRSTPMRSLDRFGLVRFCSRHGLNICNERSVVVAWSQRVTAVCRPRPRIPHRHCQRSSRRLLASFFPGATVSRAPDPPSPLTPPPLTPPYHPQPPSTASAAAVASNKIIGPAATRPPPQATRGSAGTMRKPRQSLTIDEKLKMR